MKTFTSGGTWPARRILRAVPELRHLRAFVAVAEELNFTRAAERLVVGQQAVSKSLNQLERQLGVTLVERTTHAVSLTAAGEVLLQSGRPALTAVDAAFRSARDAGRGLTGTIRVGCSPAVGPVDRREVIDRLRADAPAVSVSVEEVRPAELARRLGDGELDFALTRTLRRVPALESVALRPTNVVLCVPEAHRLAAAGSASLAELEGERLLVWDRPGTPFTDLLVGRISAAGATVQPLQARLMGEGLSLAELPESGAVALMPIGWPSREGVVQVPLSDEMTLPLLLVWRMGAAPPAARRLRAAMSSG